MRTILSTVTNTFYLPNPRYLESIVKHRFIIAMIATDDNITYFVEIFSFIKSVIKSDLYLGI